MTVTTDRGDGMALEHDEDRGVESLGTFGEVSDEAELEELDLPPIPFTLVGYTRARLDEDGEPDPDGQHRRVENEFHVIPTHSFGPTFNALQETDSKGRIPVSAAVKFVADCLVAEDRERFHETLRDPGVNYKAEMLGDIAERLAERYGLRPTQSRSERRSGPRPAGQTSTGGRAETGSISGRVTTPLRST